MSFTLFLNHPIMSTEMFLVDFADFSCKKLSVEQKKWLVDRINSKAEKASSLAKRYKLSINKLHQYVCRSKKGNTLCSRCGRPRVLSQNSINELEAYAKQDPKPSKDDIKARIKELYCNEHLQEGVSDEFYSVHQRKTTHISERSVARYVTLCDNSSIVDLVMEKHN